MSRAADSASLNLMDRTVRVVKAGVLYFAAVFAAGFVLGTIRTLWIAPRLGTRAAELIETPLMLVISFFAARSIVARVGTIAAFERLALGVIALLLMLLTEFTFVLWVRGLTLSQYFAGRDPISGNVYLFALALFSLMPLLVKQGTR